MASTLCISFGDSTKNSAWGKYHSSQVCIIMLHYVIRLSESSGDFMICKLCTTWHDFSFQICFHLMLLKKRKYDAIWKRKQNGKEFAGYSVRKILKIIHHASRQPALTCAKSHSTKFPLVWFMNFLTSMFLMINEIVPLRFIKCTQSVQFCWTKIQRSKIDAVYCSPLVSIVLILYIDGTIKCINFMRIHARAHLCPTRIARSIWHHAITEYRSENRCLGSIFF